MGTYLATSRQEEIVKFRSSCAWTVDKVITHMSRFCEKQSISFPAPTQIARFMGPTWGPPGSCRPRWAHVGPKNRVIRVLYDTYPMVTQLNASDHCHHWVMQRHVTEPLPWPLGPHSMLISRLTSIWNPIVEIRRSYDYVHNGNSYTDKTAYLHWVRP